MFKFLFNNRLITCLLILIILVSTSCESRSQKDTIIKINGTVFTLYSKVFIPSSLTYCNEEVPLKDSEIRERLEKEILLLLQQPGQIVLYLKRSGRVFSQIEPILKKYSIPNDVKYLAVAESALIINTSSKGAQGIWQIMPETGRSLGLQVDEYIDERNDIDKSTVAACQYLQQGYSKFKNWTLTCAGYNMGHNGLNGSINNQSRKDYYDLFLNSETYRYIFRILAIKVIFENKDKYGLILDESDYYQPYEVTSKEVEEVANLAQWAVDNGTSLREVKYLNPWLINTSIPKSNKKFSIQIPKR
ncbi:MAG: lytic transglycosylase domain-containing protein [Candidatus Kapabacteria bacterium]|nr:lytic transglycosylase domain-containing protein [Candidatus Kapabacteria bacterium]